MKLNANASFGVTTTWTCSLAVAALGVATFGQSSVTRVSVDSNGGEANAGSGALAVTDDGRFVAFESTARLVAADLGVYADIYVRDRLLGTTTLVSRSSSGEHGDRRSLRPSISADGRFVAFTSWSTNFGTSAALPDPEHVFVRDLALGTTIPITTAPANSDFAVISPDGRFVAFESENWPNGWYADHELYLWDRNTGQVELVSTSSSGAPVGGSHASISADGRFVAFQASFHFTTGDNNGAPDVFVRDRQAGVTLLASANMFGGGTGNAGSVLPALSADGRWVAFFSRASDLVQGTGALPNVFLRDLQLGTTIVASRTDEGEPSGVTWMYDGAHSISSDGRFVAYRSDDALPTDNNHQLDVLLFDVVANATSVVSSPTAGAGSNSESGSYIAMTPDARVVVFSSRATNLVAGDTNGVEDVFVREVVPLSGTTFCTAGVTSNGCVPAISALGIPSASAGSGFSIRVSAVEGARSGMLFYGLDNSGFVPSPWGASSSFLCVKQPAQRTAVHDSGGAAGQCDGALALEWNAYVVANPTSLGAPFATGQHVFAQGWFRDPPSTKTTMLSNGLEFVVAP